MRPPDPALRLRRPARVAGLLGAVLVLGTACMTGTPEGVTAVSGFEIDRYLGTWYEIARLDHRFERGLTDVTAEYRLRDEGGISVVNRGFDPESGEWSEARGKAFFVEEETKGMLKVSFFGPFYGGYNVIDLDHEGYRWSMVAGPDRSYLWILARTPQLDAAVLERLVAEADRLGFPTEELIFVEHGVAARDDRRGPDG